MGGKKCNEAISSSINAAIFIGVDKDGNYYAPKYLGIWIREKDDNSLKPQPVNVEDVDLVFSNSYANGHFPRIQKSVQVANLDAMTVSFYMKSDPGNNNPGTPFSYAATHRWGNDFLFYDYRKSHVYVKNRINGGNTRKLNDGQWHAICMSWNNDGKVNLFVDFEQTFTTQTNANMDGNGIITIGQEQDTKGGKFDNSQRFYGRLNRVNVFKRFVNSKVEC